MSRRTGLALACFVALVVAGLLVTTRDRAREPGAARVEAPAASERAAAELLVEAATARAVVAPESPADEGAEAPAVPSFARLERWDPFGPLILQVAVASQRA